MHRLIYPWVICSALSIFSLHLTFFPLPRLRSSGIFLIFLLTCLSFFHVTFILVLTRFELGWLYGGTWALRVDWPFGGWWDEGKGRTRGGWEEEKGREDRHFSYWYTGPEGNFTPFFCILYIFVYYFRIFLFISFICSYFLLFHFFSKLKIYLRN